MTDHVPAPVVDDDLREQMARALREYPVEVSSFGLMVPPEPSRMADALLPVVTAHVAAEGERAVAEVVGAVRNVLAEYRPQLDRRHGPDLPVDLWDDIRAALPAQPADQAQETDR